MAWAWASGIPVPEFAIVAYGRLAGTELRLAPADALCLAIRRFDRVGPGKLHAEDMAQVFGRMPHEKCDRRLNYETLARAVHVLCGVEDLRVFVRRLVFTVLVGNTNAHLKNWALVYPDGRKPRLAPAYDQVATVVMPNVRRALALPFNGSLEFDTVSLGGFQRMAGKLGLDPREVGRLGDGGRRGDHGRVDRREGPAVVGVPRGGRCAPREAVRGGGLAAAGVRGYGFAGSL
jgi:serine/threonine-protein kinase HipA